MGIDFLLYTLGYGLFFFLWITYSKTFFMQPQNKINNPTQFVRIVFEFESFEYLRYNDFNSISQAAYESEYTFIVIMLLLERTSPFLYISNSFVFTDAI